MGRPPLLPTLGVLAVSLLATGGLTYAADQKLAGAPSVPPAQPKPAVLVVPDVRGQAYVFAKVALDDAGFAWRVGGPVRGFAANTVAAQAPAAGTKVVDTGAPLVTLTLSQNKSYREAGNAENASPYAATAVRPADLALALGPAPAVHAAPAKSAEQAKPAQVAKPAAKHVVAKKTVAKKTVAKKKHVAARPPAFLVDGAPREPLDEPPLTVRAQELGRWLATHPKPTDANVRHWLYQNEWVVTGARFGWWHGADALRTLIAVDTRAESLWGIGSKSRSRAEWALSVVTAQARG